MQRSRIAGFALMTVTAAMHAQAPSATPLRIGIVGLAHGHVAGFLNGGALVPAGGALHRADVQVVGIAERDRELFDRYAGQYKLASDLYFPTLDQMISRAHPQAVLVSTSTYDHTGVVEECARRGVHVMMEKPLAVSYKDAVTMQEAARRGNIHVLVDYETTWYPSNKAAYDLVREGALGEIRKVVVHDGHRGPKEIHVQPEFFAWLTDPKLNGAGALYDFGCYGADLMTWLMKGEAPQTVTAVTKQMKPDIYPKVDDEADVILTYPKAVAILQGSWNWPFDRKDMEVYGETGYAKTIRGDHVDVRREGDKEGAITEARALDAPNDDPLHYLAAVINGQVHDEDDLSALRTNIVVSEILDAARQSAQSGRTIALPLH
ncbi:MAG: Gfo/Idh/MocA family oxidoreductase [Acidobacteriaceae bacterium]|nr:Gfo/Idh/MocA family oxidoreductase [Acidobacteriaceae bacterium]